MVAWKATNRPTNHVFHHTSQISPRIPPTNFTTSAETHPPLSPPLLPWGDPTPLQRSNFFLDIGSPGRRSNGAVPRNFFTPEVFFHSDCTPLKSHGWLGLEDGNNVCLFGLFGPFSGANSGKLLGSSGYFTPFITGSDWRPVWCLERVPNILPKWSEFFMFTPARSSENHCHLLWIHATHVVEVILLFRENNPVKMLMNLCASHPAPRTSKLRKMASPSAANMSSPCSSRGKTKRMWRHYVFRVHLVMTPYRWLDFKDF